MGGGSGVVSMVTVVGGKCMGGCAWVTGVSAHREDQYFFDASVRSENGGPNANLYRGSGICLRVAVGNGASLLCPDDAGVYPKVIGSSFVLASFMT